MKRILLALALAACCVPSLKAEDGVVSLKTWFTHWAEALERSAVENRYRNMRTETAVAAVRGAGQQAVDPTKPYWKGGWTEKRAAERLKERRELSAAVQFVLDGKTAEARQAFDAFDKTHPNSGFKDDVAAGRAKLAALEKAIAPAAAPAASTAAPAPAAPAALAAPAASAPPAATTAAP